MKRPEEAIPLLKGTLDLLCLKALSFGPAHGYGVASWLESMSEGVLDVEDSALYQALHRLEGRRLVRAEWGITENNRKAKYYRLTREGRAHLRDEAATWSRYTRTVTAVMALQPEG
jgi:transcriptional regulator